MLLLCLCGLRSSRTADALSSSLLRRFVVDSRTLVRVCVIPVVSVSPISLHSGKLMFRPVITNTMHMVMLCMSGMTGRQGEKGEKDVNREADSRQHQAAIFLPAAAASEAAIPASSSSLTPLPDITTHLSASHDDDDDDDVYMPQPAVIRQQMLLPHLSLICLS